MVATVARGPSQSDVTCQSSLEDLKILSHCLPDRWLGQTRSVERAGSCRFQRIRSITRQLDGVLCSGKYRSQHDREVQRMVTETLVSRRPCPSGMSDGYLFDTKYLLCPRAIQVVIILCYACGPATWIKKVQACWDPFVLKNAV